MQQKDALTANGAVTNSTSLNKCLDFFFIAGNRVDFTKEFLAAYGEDPIIATRILFWSRDCRGGSGARLGFQSVLKYLQNNNKQLFSKLFKYIPEYGYWKDIFVLEPTEELLEFTWVTLSNDKDYSLCAKFFPRKGQWFKKMCGYKNLKFSDFRHLLVSKTQVVENLICSKQFSSIDYSHVPSLANKLYSKTFSKWDGTRYQAYLESVLKGDSSMNAGVLYPCDIYHFFDTKRDGNAARAMWKNLKQYNYTERILPICDVSGSMTCGPDKIKPIDVSISLGVYLSEHNTGVFHNAFMTFSSDPDFVYLTGDDIISKFNQLERSEWGFNTDLVKSFQLILDQAIKHNLSQEDMPSKVLIISDMQFDSCGDLTNFECINKMYNEAGYTRPGLVFWNVCGKAGNVPANMYDENVALISGYSPAIIESVLNCDILTSMEIMIRTVFSNRYSSIII